MSNPYVDAAASVVQNAGRLEQFINETGGYVTSSGAKKETAQDMLARKEADLTLAVDSAVASSTTILNGIVDEAEAARDTALQAAEMASTPVAKLYATKAAANADLANRTNGQWVEVIADESVTPAGSRTRYEVVSGAYVFRVNLDQTRIDLTPMIDSSIAGPRRYGSPLIYDLFDRSDRTLSGDIAPSGQTWQLSGPALATARIEGGRYISPEGNVYASIDAGQNVQRVAGAFSFGRDNTGTDRTIKSLTLIASASALNLNTMLHAEIGPDAMYLTKRLSGGDFVALATVNYELKTDGTVYGAALEIDVGSTSVTMTAPDGTRVTVVDSDVATVSPQAAIWQIRPSGVGEWVGSWHGIYIGKQVADVASVMAGAASAGVASTAYALAAGIDGFKRRQKSFTTSAVGWYRILVRGIYTTYQIGGRIKLSASNGVSSQQWELRAFQPLSSLSLLKSLAGNFTAAAIVTQARVSYDATNLLTAVDIYVNTATPSTINVEFDGIGETEAAPTVGATALPTGSTVVSFNISDRKVQNAAPSSGATVTVDADTDTLFLTPGGTLASLTIQLSPSAPPGKIVNIYSSATITALTVTASGWTIMNNPTTLGQTSPRSFEYLPFSLVQAR